MNIEPALLTLEMKLHFKLVRYYPFDSLLTLTRKPKTLQKEGSGLSERVRGVEPLSGPWQGPIIPVYDTRNYERQYTTKMDRINIQELEGVGDVCVA